MRYEDIAPKLFDNGWRNMIPLTHAKGTTVKWGALQHQPMTEKTLDWFINHRFFSPDVRRMIRGGDCERIGMVHGACHGIVSIDIDEEDEQAALAIRAHIETHLPPTDFVRVGKSPKMLLMYRGNVRSQKPHPIEIFGHSGQIAAFGMHPKTRRPYQWIHDMSPLDASPEDLPEITEQQVRAFLSEIKTEKVVIRRSSGHRVTLFDWGVLAAERKVDGVNAAARQLQNISDGNRNNVLLSVTGYVVGELGCSPEEAVEFADKWFPAACRTEEYANLDDVVRRMAEEGVRKWETTDWDLEDE